MVSKASMYASENFELFYQQTMKKNRKRIDSSSDMKIFESICTFERVKTEKNITRRM